MPTFGPTWVNLYGSLRSYSFSDLHMALNRGVGEGVAYRGQLLVGLDVKLADPMRDTMAVAALEEHNPLQPLNIVRYSWGIAFFIRTRCVVPTIENGKELICLMFQFFLFLLLSTQNQVPQIIIVEIF